MRLFKHIRDKREEYRKEEYREEYRKKEQRWIEMAAERKALSITLIKQLIKLYEQEQPVVEKGSVNGWNPGSYVITKTHKGEPLYEVFHEQYRPGVYTIDVWTDKDRTSFYEAMGFSPFYNGVDYAKILYDFTMFGDKSPETAQKLAFLSKIPLTETSANDVWPFYCMNVLTYLNQRLNTKTK